MRLPGDPLGRRFHRRPRAIAQPVNEQGDQAPRPVGILAGGLPGEVGHCAQQVIGLHIGAHLTGQPLNHQLTERGGRLLRATRTAPVYALYALPTTPPKPGLVRVDQGGAAIAAELWQMPLDRFGEFVLDVAAPLAIGTVELADGSSHPGFVCEGIALETAPDITRYGGWLAYREAQP